MSELEVEKAPSIGISLNVELPGKKQLVLQSLVERDCASADLNAVLDKLRIATERQFAFGAIEQLRMQLEQEEKLASDHAARMAQVDENIRAEWNRSPKRGEAKLSDRQIKEQQQAYAHAEESKKRIAKVKANIAEYQAKIDGTQIGA